MQEHEGATPTEPTAGPASSPSGEPAPPFLPPPKQAGAPSGAPRAAGPFSVLRAPLHGFGPFAGLVRRRGVLLPEDRVDPETGSLPAVDPTELVVLSNPISTGFRLTTGVMLALALVWVLQANGQLLVWILAALFIALGLDPIVRRIERWGAPRWVGVLAAALGLAAVVGAFVALLVPTVVEQSTQLLANLPAAVEGVMATDWFRFLDEQFQIQHAVRDQTERLVAGGDSATAVFGGLVGFGQTVMNAVFSGVVVVVLTLYFLASLPHMKYWAYRLARRSNRPRVERLATEITSSVGHYVMGQTVVAALNGTVAFIALTIAGAPFAALLAFTAAGLAFIPLVGALIGGGILTAVCLLESWETAALFAAIYFVYLQIEAYVVSPRVMARAVAVPAAVGVIAVIAGGTLLGVLGALMAIPTAAAVLLLVREVFIPRQDAR